MSTTTKTRPGFTAYKEARKTMTNLPALSNVSNPTAFGVQWATEDSGTPAQLVNIRGTKGLLFGLKVRGEWHTNSVTAPERFLSRPPKSFKEFLDGAVKAWFDAYEEAGK